MTASWQRIWRQYEHGIITASELVGALIHRLRDTDVAALIESLPEGYRETLRGYVQSGSIPFGTYCFADASKEESVELHRGALQYNTEAVEVIRAYFQGKSERRGSPR